MLLKSCLWVVEVLGGCIGFFEVVCWLWRFFEVVCGDTPALLLERPLSICVFVASCLGLCVVSSSVASIALDNCFCL